MTAGVNGDEQRGVKWGRTRKRGPKYGTNDKRKKKKKHKKITVSLAPHFYGWGRRRDEGYIANNEFKKRNPTGKFSVLLYSQI